MKSILSTSAIAALLLASTASADPAGDVAEAPAAPAAEPTTAETADTDARLDALETQLGELVGLLKASMAAKEPEEAATEGMTEVRDASAAEDAAPSGEAKTKPEPTRATLRPLERGQLVTILQMSEDRDEIPNTALVQFMGASDEYRIGGYVDQLGFDVGRNIAWKIEALLPIETAGLHSFISTVRLPQSDEWEISKDSGDNPSCRSRILIDDVMVGDEWSQLTQVDAPVTAAFAAELDAGEYRIEYFVVCIVPRLDATGMQHRFSHWTYPNTMDVNFGLMIKSPDRPKPTPMGEILAVEVAS